MLFGVPHQLPAPNISTFTQQPPALERRVALQPNQSGDFYQTTKQQTAKPAVKPRKTPKAPPREGVVITRTRAPQTNPMIGPDPDRARPFSEERPVKVPGYNPRRGKDLTLKNPFTGETSSDWQVSDQTKQAKKPGIVEGVRRNWQQRRNTNNRRNEAAIESWRLQLIRNPLEKLGISTPKLNRQINAAETKKQQEQQNLERQRGWRLTR